MTRCKTKRSCDQCGKEFDAGTKVARFCSSQCRGIVKKPCEGCGKDFSSRKRSNTRTCSIACRAAINKHPQKGSSKACEVCGEVFVVKYVRWSRTCGRKCAVVLRNNEGTNSQLCVPSTWQSRLKACIKTKQRQWQKSLNKCPQCGLHRAWKGQRCKKCVNRLSANGLAQTLNRVKEFLTRINKKCKACSNIAQFRKHFCDSCLRQKKRDTHTCNHRQRCRKNGAEYEHGVTIKAIVARDGMQCHYCKKQTVRWNGCWTQDITTLDHVIPISKRGGHTMANVVIACGECNSRKCDKVNTLF